MGVEKVQGQDTFIFIFWQKFLPMSLDLCGGRRAKELINNPFVCLSWGICGGVAYGPILPELHNWAGKLTSHRDSDLVRALAPMGEAPHTCHAHEEGLSEHR